MNDTERKAIKAAGLDPDDLVDEMGARTILGLGKPIARTTLRRGIKAGRYPRPIEIHAHLHLWRISELRAALVRMEQGRA